MILNKFLHKSGFIFASNFIINQKSVLTITSRLAGHSHWQNVKDTKEMKDKMKTENIRIITGLMRIAIRDGNNIRDPKLNSKLATVLERAKSLNVATSSIEKVLADVETIDPYIIEYQARGGIFLLVESCNKHANKEKMEVQSVVKVYGFKPVKSSILRNIFSHGAVVIGKADDKILTSEDSALEIGLEVGASEVKWEINPLTNEPTYQFHCQPRDVSTLRNGLSNKGVEIIDSYDYYDPVQKAEVDETTDSLLKEMYKKLFATKDSIQRLFDNTVPMKLRP